MHFNACMQSCSTKIRMMSIATRTFDGIPIGKRSDGYVDATAACRACQKEFKFYRRMESTNKYLECLAKTLSKEIDELVCTDRGIGTWVHPSVALDLGRWLRTDFAIWMDAWILEEINKSTAVQPKRLYKNQLEIRSETQLHESVVKFIRDRFPDALILPSLGESGDDEEKRLANWRKGYRSGSPDLLLLMRHPKYVGLALEFKHPGGLGKTSDLQEQFLQDLRSQGWMTLVSDNYTDIILTVNDYAREASIVCPQCQKQCPTLTALGQHVRSTHSDSQTKRRRGADVPAAAAEQD